MKYYLPIFLSVALGACCWAQVAPLSGESPVRPAFESADLVCGGLVISEKAIAAETGTKKVTVVLKVLDVYKWTTQEPSFIMVEYDEGHFWVGEKAVLFLKLRAPSVYTLSDRFIGSTPFSSIPVQSTAPGLAKLEFTLAAIAQHSNRADQVNAMRLLQGFDVLSVSTVSTLSALSASRDPEIAFSAFAVLLKSKGPQDVARFATYLSQYSPESPPAATLSIGYELGSIQDEKALPAVEALTNSTLISIRIGAMQALRAMKNPTSAPTLAKKLDDSDAYVRYLAVISLAETFGKYDDYAPNMQLFDSNPEFYVQTWKSWLAQQGYVSP
jgi:hypothetical protein